MPNIYEFVVELEFDDSTSEQTAKDILNDLLPANDIGIISVRSTAEILKELERIKTLLKGK